MAKLKPDAIMIDLVDQGVYGDLDHCPKEDLLESAQALLDILPLVQHRGIWGLSKAYDNDVYVYTIGKDFKVPADLPLATHNGKPARATVHHGRSREQYWAMTWYERTPAPSRTGRPLPIPATCPTITRRHQPRPMCREALEGAPEGNRGFRSRR